MRMPPLPADSIHARACKLKCEKILTRPWVAIWYAALQTVLIDLHLFRQHMTKSRNNLDIVGCKSTVPRCCGFFIFKISEVQKKMPNRNFLNRMDLNSEFRYLGAHSSSGRPFSSQKGRPSTEKLYTKNRVPVCWYQKINRPGFFVFRHKRKRAPSPGKDGNSHGQHTAHLFCGT